MPVSRIAVRPKRRRRTKAYVSRWLFHLIEKSLKFGVVQPPFTSVMKRKVKLQFKSACFNCGATTRLQLDHHQPLCRGNALVYGNCVVLCRPCNLEKSTMLPESFYPKAKLVRLEAILALQRTFTK
jgi:5-methylcytosine-specific restriction endonuclease McrA